MTIWNETNFEKNLKKVLKATFGREAGGEYMSLYVQARRFLLENVFEEIRGREPNLTDHGSRHIRHVLDNVFKLLDGNLEYFTPIEHYLLGLSVLFHDTGNLLGREKHREHIAHFYDHVRTDSTRFAQEKALVVRISQAHTGTARNGSRNTLADVPKLWQLDGMSVRTREIAAILRFADELAEGRRRTSEYMRKSGMYTADSISHHDYSAATDITVDGQNERIAITCQFSVGTKQNLEDELSRLTDSLEFAYGRIAKTDIERRYARFHCPKPLARFRRISVCLDIQVDGEFVQPPLETTISDEVNLDDPPPGTPISRDPNWKPEAVVDRIRQEVHRRKNDGK